MRGAKEDSGLAEVKAILVKLQRLDLAAHEEIDQASPKSPNSARGRDRPAAAPAQKEMGVFDRKHAAFVASDKKANQKPRGADYRAIAGALVAAALILIVAAVIVIYLPSSSKKNADIAAPAPQHTSVNVGPLLVEARRILSEGNVTLARTRLLQGEPDRNAEAAFMLAQSYDPNYLQSLPKANDLPNRPEAEHWYKKWYELAVQSGLEMDSGRLQRLINAMH